MRPKLLDLKPGTRVSSNSFDMGDWEPDARETSEPCSSWCTALSWIVPAKVGGSWQVGGDTLSLTQNYQRLSGTLGGAAITAGRLTGDAITFTANGRLYEGRVDGDRISGEGWSATRSR